jgi:Kef-type K+ transport system membrane component KefB
MLMFVVGTHLPLRDASMRRSLRPAALATVLLFVLAVPAGYLLTTLGPDRPFVLAVLVASSSAAVALPILQSLGTAVTATPAAAFATAWITLTDVVTVLAVPLVLTTGALGHVLAGAGLVLLGGGVVFLGLRYLRRTGAMKSIRKMSKRRGWALDLRVGLAVLFAFAALATAFGTSILIAGFTAGVVLAATGEPHRLAQQLVGVAEGFLVPLFFVILGAQLQFAALFTSDRALLLFAGIAVATTAAHVVVALVVRRPLAVGLLATASLGVPSAIVSIGLAQGVLDAGQAAAIVSAVLVTIAVSATGGVLLGRRGTTVGA